MTEQTHTRITKAGNSYLEELLKLRPEAKRPFLLEELVRKELERERKKQGK